MLSKGFTFKNVFLPLGLESKEIILIHCDEHERNSEGGEKKEEPDIFAERLHNSQIGCKLLWRR